MGRTNYLGISGCGSARGAGALVAAGNDGVLTNRSAWALGKIPDGTSNTLMFGEACGRTYDSNPATPNLLDIGIMGGACNPTAFGLKAGGPTCNTYQFSSY